MADQHARQERVGIDPDLAVFPNRANLHADLVGMADDHQLEHVVLARMRVQYHTSVALELMQVPARRGKAFEIGLENAIGHGALQAYGAGRRQNVTHQGELCVRHGLGPRGCGIGHGETSLTAVVSAY